MVAPRAGAWIETEYTITDENLIPVAPRAGAWIETFIYGLLLRCQPKSHPARGRGLKL